MKKVVVITGSRAEYGLLHKTLQEIKKSKKLKLFLVATGSHISNKYGDTYKAIVNDGHKIDYKVRILNKENIQENIPTFISGAINKLTKIFVNIRPDIILLLGDRYEIFAAATCATSLNIPIAHIHGGEITEGSMDNVMRHAITKMSHLHFVSHRDYARRVHQMGEEKKNIYNVGAPGLELISKIKLLGKFDLEKELSIKLNKHNILITFHPLTIQNNLTKKSFNNLLKALTTLDKTNFYFTKANADADGDVINSMIDNFVSKNKNAFSFISLGQLRYLSLLKQIDVVVGNSSSGVVEAPFLNKATVNIGNRQSGRIKLPSIIDCDSSSKNILKSIRFSYSKKFKNKSIKNKKNPFFKPNTSKKIVKVLEEINLENILLKKFYDI